MSRNHLLRLALLLGVSGCVGGLGSVRPAGPVAQGRSLLQAGRLDEARQAFEEALALEPANPEARLGLGATLEAADQLDSARSVYVALSDEQLPAAVRNQLAGRIHLLSRRVLALAARDAVANEDSLTRELPVPSTLAVLPFLYQGGKPDLAPLGRGLAQLFVTDLGQISALTLLERERVGPLLAEAQIADSGLVDSATAVRSGRLLRAAEVLQGSIADVPGEARLMVDANLVSASTAEILARRSAANPLEELFDLEKTILFGLIDRLGVPVTPGERERLADRPTQNLVAFIAFSRGLEAADGGDFARAAAEFQTAATLDPAFAQAAEQAATAAAMSVASATSPAQVAQMLEQASAAASFLAENLNRVMPSGMELVDRVQIPRETLPPGGRDPLIDVGGGDTVHPPAGTGSIEIRVRRP